MSKDRRHIPKQQTIFNFAFKIVSKNTKCYKMLQQERMAEN